MAPKLLPVMVSCTAEEVGPFEGDSPEREGAEKAKDWLYVTGS